MALENKLPLIEKETSLYKKGPLLKRLEEQKKLNTLKYEKTTREYGVYKDRK